MAQQQSPPALPQSVQRVAAGRQVEVVHGRGAYLYAGGQNITDTCDGTLTITTFPDHKIIYRVTAGPDLSVSFSGNDSNMAHAFEATDRDGLSGHPLNRIEVVIDGEGSAWNLRFGGGSCDVRKRAGHVVGLMCEGMPIGRIEFTGQ